MLPIFALANTGIVVGGDWASDLTSSNSLGIILGLFVGKPIGITVLAFIAVMIGICRLPLDLKWKHVFGAGMLGGIGFTMSIFITNLAFVGGEPAFVANTVNASKMAILVASLSAGIGGYLWLSILSKRAAAGTDEDLINYAEDDEEAVA